MGDLAVQTLEPYAPGIAGTRRTHVVTPADLEREYGLSGGHPMHGEHALDQFFAWRPLLGHARYRFGIPGSTCAGRAHTRGRRHRRPGATQPARSSPTSRSADTPKPDAGSSAGRAGR